MMQQPAPFDYSGIDPEIAALMRQTAQNIHAHVRQTVENAAADGEALIKIKDYLTHGSFMGWVQNVLGLEPRTAQNMMQTAILCRSNARYFAFGLTVVQELAAPSTPDDVRGAVLAGDVAPTVKDVKAAKKAAKAGAPFMWAGAFTPSNGSARSQSAPYEPPRPAPLASSDVRADAPSVGALLYNLLTGDELDPLDTDEGKEDLIYFLSDTDVPGDARRLRGTAEMVASILLECATLAAERPPTDATEDAAVD